MSVQCDNFVNSDYLDHIKVIHDRSASTISDCYSSDDDYKEGILHDYLLKQSTVLMSHEAVAFNGDQREFEDNGFSKINSGTKGGQESDKNYHENCWKTEYNLKIPTTNFDIKYSSSPVNQNSPEYLFEKCVSEFYRPPSRLKENLLGNSKIFDEDASILDHHFTESDMPVAHLKSSLYKVNLQTKIDYINDNYVSTSLFNPVNQFQEYKHNSHDNSTIKLMSIASLNDHSQFDSESDLVKIPNSKKDLFHMCRSELEYVSHSVSFKQPNTVPLIKSTKLQFITNEIGDNFQTSSGVMHTEKCIGTSLTSETEKTQKEMKLCRDVEETDDVITNFLSQSTNIMKYLLDILSILQHHVNKITEVNKNYKNENIVSFDNEDTDFGLENKTNINEKGYPDHFVKALFTQVRHMYFQLDSKIKYPAKNNKRKKHKRHFSEIARNRNSMYISGCDITCNPEFIMGVTPLKNKLKSLKVNSLSSINNCESDTIPLHENKDGSCRIFELNPYDDLIKSYQSHSDRRIKAVGNKMKCKIVIEGPIRIYDSTNGCWNMRNKVAYRCSLNGSTKESVEKCLKCLQDTFPQSFLNEKHVISKFENKQLIS